MQGMSPEIMRQFGQQPQQPKEPPKPAQLTPLTIFYSQAGKNGTVSIQPEILNEKPRLFANVADGHDNFFQLRTGLGFLTARAIDKETGKLTNDYKIYQYDEKNEKWPDAQNADADQLKTMIGNLHAKKGWLFDDDLYEKHYSKHWLEPKEIRKAAIEIAGINNDSQFIPEHILFKSNSDGTKLPVDPIKKALASDTIKHLIDLGKKNSTSKAGLEYLAKHHFVKAPQDMAARMPLIIAAGAEKNKETLRQIFEKNPNLHNYFSQLIDNNQELAILLDENGKIPAAAQLAANQLTSQPITTEKINAFFKQTTFNKELPQNHIDTQRGNIEQFLQHDSDAYIKGKDFNIKINKFNLVIQPITQSIKLFNENTQLDLTPLNYKDRLKALSVSQLLSLYNELNRALDSKNKLINLYNDIENIDDEIKKDILTRQFIVAFCIFPNHQTDTEYHRQIESFEKKIPAGITAQQLPTTNAVLINDKLRSADRLLSDINSDLTAFHQSYLETTEISTSKLNTFEKARKELAEKSKIIEAHMHALSNFRIQSLTQPAISPQLDNQLEEIESKLRDLQMLQEKVQSTLNLMPQHKQNFKRTFEIFARDPKTGELWTKPVTSIEALLNAPAKQPFDSKTAETSITYKKHPDVAGEVSGSIKIKDSSSDRMKKAFKRSIPQLVKNLGPDKNFYISYHDQDLIAYAASQLIEAGVNKNNIHFRNSDGLNRFTNWIKETVSPLDNKIVPIKLSAAAISKLSTAEMQKWPKNWLFSLEPKKIQGLSYDALLTGIQCGQSMNPKLLDHAVKNTGQKEIQALEAIYHHNRFDDLPPSIINKISLALVNAGSSVTVPNKPGVTPRP